MHPVVNWLIHCEQPGTLFRPRIRRGIIRRSELSSTARLVQEMPYFRDADFTHRVNLLSQRLVNRLTTVIPDQFLQVQRARVYWLSKTKQWTCQNLKITPFWILVLTKQFCCSSTRLELKLDKTIKTGMSARVSVELRSLKLDDVRLGHLMVIKYEASLAHDVDTAGTLLK